MIKLILEVSLDIEVNNFLTPHYDMHFSIVINFSIAIVISLLHIYLKTDCMHIVANQSML